MCDMCFNTPCVQGCPNQEEPKAVHVCAWCEEDIVEGEYYYDVNQDIICVECMDECRKEAEAATDYRDN